MSIYAAEAVTPSRPSFAAASAERRSLSAARDVSASVAMPSTAQWLRSSLPVTAPAFFCAEISRAAGTMNQKFLIYRPTIAQPVGDGGYADQVTVCSGLIPPRRLQRPRRVHIPRRSGEKKRRRVACGRAARSPGRGQGHAAY